MARLSSYFGDLGASMSFLSRFIIRLKILLKFQIPFPAIFITPEVFLPEIIVKMAWNMQGMGFNPKDQFVYLKNFGMLNR